MDNDKNTTLTNDDLAMLGKFRINPSVLEKAGIYRVTDAEARKLGFRFKGKLDGILFTYMTGGKRINARIRRDNPEMEGGTPKNKYVSRPGKTRCLYSVSADDDLMQDGSCPILLVEAEKSVLASCSMAQRAGRRMLPLGTSGVWGWRNGGGQALPQFDAITWTKRLVLICFDSNVMTNGKVRKAESDLVQELQTRGADVRCVRLPQEPGVNGPDDFIALHTDAEFLHLLDNAQEWKPAGDEKSPRGSQTDLLVEMGQGFELFHNVEGEAFATVPVNGHSETYRVQSKEFGLRLENQYFTRFAKVPQAQSLKDALHAINGIAVHQGREIATHYRIAEDQGRIYYDLGDSFWRAVEIDAEGWRIVENPPVKFVRYSCMLAMPEPQRGGSLNDLRKVLNVQGDWDFALIKAFVIAAMRPGRPFVFLVFVGESGSAKTTQSKWLKQLIDPTVPDTRSLPRKEQDLAIAAQRNWCLVFENLSYISSEVSDRLCRLSTGGGFGGRELYSDDGEKTFNYRRPAIFNGITDFITREDLLRRSIIIHLPIIPDAERLTEESAEARFYELRPELFGAVLDAISCALRLKDSVHIEKKPSMADFAQWAVAAEPSHSSQPMFLEAIRRNQSDSRIKMLDASPIGPEIQSFIQDVHTWKGTSTELLARLNERVLSCDRPRGWPDSPRQLSDELRRIAPNLRATRIQIDFTERDNPTIISMNLLGTGASGASSASDSGEAREAPEADFENIGVPPRPQPTTDPRIVSDPG